MQIDSPETIFELSDVEVETIRRAALERGLPFDCDKVKYSGEELNQYGIVREAYNSVELRAFGIKNNKVITSFDIQAKEAREKLLVDAPFATSIKKWQIPVDVCEWRVFIAEFPENTLVEPHVHAANTPAEPGGSLRTILKGSITYAGKTFGPGDWFFIPNGVPYSFRTSSEAPTIVMYKYAFFAVAAGNRFSHPVEIETYRVGVTSSAA
jgi:hypothetical protein